MSVSVTKKNKVSLVEFAQIWALKQGWGKLPQVHIDICNWLEHSDEDKGRVLMAYRHIGKSHLLGCYIAWKLLCDPDYTFIIASASSKVASRNSDFIRELIETHPLTKHLVNVDDFWQRTAFRVRRNSVKLNPSVICSTVRSTNTGLHCDEFIGDDIEVEENCKTVEQRDVLRSFMSKISKIAHRKLYIGTPHHEETIYDYLENTLQFNVYRRKVWDDHGLPTQRPANPEMGHDENWIKQQQLESKTIAEFNSQYLLVPAVVADVKLKIELFRKYVGEVRPHPILRHTVGRQSTPLFFLTHDEDTTDGIQITKIKAYWDPASGKPGRDNSVLAVCAQSNTGDIYVLDLVTLPAAQYDNNVGLKKQYDLVIAKMRQYYCNALSIESNHQQLIISDLKNYAKDNNVRIGVVDAVHRSQNKEVFIASALEVLMHLGKIYLHDDLFQHKRFLQELRDFPHGNKDDHIDALSGCIHEIAPKRISLLNASPLHKELPHIPTVAVAANNFRPFDKYKSIQNAGE